MRCWIAVASADHGATARAGGFLQVCHGKAAPLRRLHPGDRVAVYAPRTQRSGGAPVQGFVALGRVGEGAPYQIAQAPGFHPFRREVIWEAQAQPAPIRPLLARLSFGGPGWGARFRFGLFEVSAADMSVIAGAMQVA